MILLEYGVASLKIRSDQIGRVDLAITRFQAVAMSDSSETCRPILFSKS